MIYQRYLKRWLDIFFSALLLIVLMPLLILLMMIIKLVMGGNVFFIQARAGLNGKIFNIYKFKTMSDIYNKNGFLLDDEHRITFIGKWLRRLNLDELPSLINILKGDMSFIGPRPLLVEYLAHYNEFQQQRHDVIPGMTGWAQINGRNAISWDEKFKLDVWYVHQQSFGLDLKILLLTIIKILNLKQLNNAEHGIMPRFMGNFNKIDSA